MKKKISVVIFIILAVMLSAADLSPSAQVIKNNSIDGYNVIKAAAKVEWGTDHGMVLYTINKQCDSSMDVLASAFDASGDLSIFVEAVKNWSSPGKEIYNLEIIKNCLSGSSVFYDIFTMECDWSMVEYEYNNQMGAAGAY